MQCVALLRRKAPMSRSLIGDRSSMEEAVTGIKALGAKTFGAQADVSDPASAQSAIEKAASALGGIDVLVNNAGIMSYSPIETMPIEM